MNHRWQKQFADAYEFGAFDDPSGRLIARMIDSGAADGEILELTEERMTKFEKDMIRGRIAPFVGPRLQGGRLILGTDHRGISVSVDPDSLCAHSLLLGGSGAGKTTLLLLIILQLLGRIPGLWLTDLRKKDLRKLLPLAARMGQPLSVVPLHRARVNPLEIEGPDTTRSITRRIRSLGTSLGLPPRSRSVFVGAVWKLYRAYGVLDGRESQFPTLFDAFVEIKRDTSTNAQARHAVLDRLGGLLTEFGPGVLAWRRGWRPSQLARHAIVFEGGGLTERSVSLVIEHLLESRFMASVGASSRPLELLIALEDAQTLLSGAQDDGEVRVLDEMMALARGSGIGLMLMAQSIHGISPHLLSNTATKILGRVGHGGDVSSMGRAMGFTGEQVRWSMNHLRPGLMVAQVADPSHRRPFLLNVPELSNIPHVTEDEVHASVASLEAIPTRFAEEFRNWTPEERIEVRDRPSVNTNRSSPSNARAEPCSPSTVTPNTACQPATPTAPSPSAAPVPNCSLSDEALRLLSAINDHPGTPMNRIGKLAELSNRKLYTLRTELIERGLIRTDSLSVNTTGRPAVILLLTAEGTIALARASG